MQLIINPEFRNLLPPLSPDERAMLKASIQSEGCRDALIVWNGVIIDGHNRYEICREIDAPFDTIEMVFADEDAAMDWIDDNQMARRNLTRDQWMLALGRRYNRTKKAQGAPVGNDNAKKQRDQNEPFETTAEKLANKYGVGQATVKRAGKLAEEVESTPELAEAIRNKEPLHKIKKKLRAQKIQQKRAEIAQAAQEIEPVSRYSNFQVNAGELWKLGRHRLMCGDAYSVNDTLKLIGGVDIDALITDPPYGIDYQPVWKKADGSPSDFHPIHGDDEKFDPSTFMAYPTVCFWGANYFSDLLPVGGWVCWDKRLDETKDRMFGSPFELAWFQSATTTRSSLMIRVLHGGVINADSEKGTNNDRRYHPTQKPIVVMKELLEAITDDGSVIYDPFSGVGPILLASDDIGRTCYAMEIEPNYVSITLQRWYDKTGIMPVKDSEDG